MLRRAILKWTGLSLLLILFCLVEEYGLVNLRVFSVSPSLLPSAVAVIALFGGGHGGAVFGLVSGLVLDAGTLRPDGFFALMFLAGGAFIGNLSSYMFRKNFINALLMTLLLSGVTYTLYFFIFYLLAGRAGASGFVMVVLPQILLVTACTPAVYLPVRLISGKLFRENG